MEFRNLLHRLTTRISALSINVNLINFNLYTRTLSGLCNRANFHLKPQTSRGFLHVHAGDVNSGDSGASALID